MQICRTEKSFTVTTNIIAEIDTDKDGTPDSKDACPTDAAKIVPGVCGCGVADVDTDKDGTPDCKDACPMDKAKVKPGVCGCGVADVDTDKDGTPDCKDACPTDKKKIAPGVCGCNKADNDKDKDGVPNCNDCKPNNPSFPAKPGSACNDGNPNTVNDVVQANGCSCKGVNKKKAKCAEVTIELKNNNIVVKGLKVAAFSQVTLSKNNGRNIGVCYANCNNKETIPLSGAGIYKVKVVLFDRTWTRLCKTEKSFTVAGGAIVEDNKASTNRLIANSEATEAVKSLEKTVIGMDKVAVDITEFGATPITKGMKIYPNPASSRLFIAPNIDKQQAELTIFNQFGQIMHQVDFTTGIDEQLEIDVEQFSSGLYLVNIELENGKKITQKVMISK